MSISNSALHAHQKDGDQIYTVSFESFAWCHAIVFHPTDGLRLSDHVPWKEAILHANSIQLSKMTTIAANNHNLRRCWEQFMITAEWYENGNKKQMCAKSEPFGNSCNPLLHLWCHWPAATSNPFSSLTSQIVIRQSIVLRNKRTIECIRLRIHVWRPTHSNFEEMHPGPCPHSAFVIRVVTFGPLPLFSCWHRITTISDFLHLVHLAWPQMSEKTCS